MEPPEEASDPHGRGSPAGPPSTPALDPESPRYQPWAEKQITNAAKEKRPLKDYLSEFDALIAGQDIRDSGSWDPQHQERVLSARYSAPATRPPARRRRRRRSSGPGTTAAITPVREGSTAAQGRPPGRRRPRRGRRARAGNRSPGQPEAR
ncbi:MAG: hypothetical protein ACREOL_08590 [Candidatus Dormibacteria bacterium]